MLSFNQVVAKLKSVNPNKAVPVVATLRGHTYSLENVLVHDGRVVIHLKEDETWGHAAWSDYDVKQKLTEEGYEPSDENVEKVKSQFAVSHIADNMIETGWGCIDAAIENVEHELVKQ